MNDTKDQNASHSDGSDDGASAPSSRPSGSDEASTVWLVSFSEDDDRELSPPQIAESLRLGQIDSDTIVWREGAADWVPLGQVPELAKLLSSSGETATAPLVMPNPALMRRASPNKEATAEAKPEKADALPRPPVEPAKGVGANPATSSVGAKPATSSVGGRPTIGGRPVPVAKGTTKLGLPKMDPKAAAKATGTPLPKPAEPKVPEATPLPKPSEPSSDATTAPAPAARAASATTPSSSRARTSSPDIWATPAEEEDAPITIEPEFLRPPSPAPARAMQRARALSAGTLGMPKKKPPTPPRPPEKRNAPEPELSSDPGTPALGAISAPPVVAGPKPVEQAILSIGAPKLATELGPPTIDVSSVSSEPTGKTDEAESESSTPTESSASIVAPTERSDERTEITRPAARRSTAPKTAKWNSWPVAAAIGAFALLTWLFMQSKKAPDAPPPEAETQLAATRAAEPERAVPPAEPKAPETAAAETPSAAAPAMTVAKAEEPPQDRPKGGVSESEKPTSTTGATSPTTAVAKTATPTAPSDPKPAGAKTMEPKSAEPKAAAPAPAEPAPKEVAVGGDFDKAAAGAALTSAATEASGCRKEGDPSGVAVVHVTFSNAGHATRAIIEGPPFAGTATGGCIAATLRKATVPPYGGDRVTVTKKVVIH